MTPPLFGSFPKIHRGILKSDIVSPPAKLCRVQNMQRTKLYKVQNCAKRKKISKGAKLCKVWMGWYVGGWGEVQSTLLYRVGFQVRVKENYTARQLGRV